MPGGPFDSSKTRVAPVFDRLVQLRFQDWPLGVLLSTEYAPRGLCIDLDYVFVRGFWGASERGLQPPKSLLRWLVHTVQPQAEEKGRERRRLFQKDSATIQAALDKIEAMDEWPGRAWYLLEGLTFPDVLIETPDTLIVIEGKRTERGPTTFSKWLPGRHQIWRHIDAAWEIRGHRRVYGMFIVEGQDDDEIPAAWVEAVHNARSDAALASSLPHRSQEEREALKACMIGVTTWQRLCTRFKLDRPGALPGTAVDVLPPRSNSLAA